MEFEREGRTAVHITAIDASDTSKLTWVSHRHPCMRFQYEPKNNDATTVQTRCCAGLELQMQTGASTPLLLRMYDLKCTEDHLHTISRFLHAINQMTKASPEFNTPTRRWDLQVSKRTELIKRICPSGFLDETTHHKY